MLEFAGACNGLDEYSYLLTPGHPKPTSRAILRKAAFPTTLSKWLAIGYVHPSLRRQDCGSAGQRCRTSHRCGMRAMILDGAATAAVCSAAVDVARSLHCQRRLVTLVDRCGSNRIYKAKGTLHLRSLIVLIDGETASRAESGGGGTARPTAAARWSGNVRSAKALSRKLFVCGRHGHHLDGGSFLVRRGQAVEASASSLISWFSGMARCRQEADAQLKPPSSSLEPCPPWTVRGRVDA